MFLVRNELFSWLETHIAGSKRRYREWLQAHPAQAWRLWFESHFPLLPYSPKEQENRLMLCERVNYRYVGSKKQSGSVPVDLRLVPLTAELFSKITQGTVIPKNFWIDQCTWSQHQAVGYCLVTSAAAEEEGSVLPVSWAFSSGRIGSQLEIGIETVDSYRGRGLARIVCERLIEYCRENRLEAVWCCRRSNVGSCRLAESLGFEELRLEGGPLPYYHLPVALGDQDDDYRLMRGTTSSKHS